MEMSSIGSQQNRRTNRQSQGGSQSSGNQILRSGSNVSRNSISKNYNTENQSVSTINQNSNHYNNIFYESLSSYKDSIVFLHYNPPVEPSFIRSNLPQIDFKDLSAQFMHHIQTNYQNNYPRELKETFIKNIFDTLVKFSIHCKHIENRESEKFNMLYYILPSNFPQMETSRFEKIKKFTIYPIIMHLFERHPMDYLRIIDAYNSVQKNDADKIPKDHYLDSNNKKLIEIDAFVNHESAEKFLQGVQAVLFGIIGSEDIKKSSEPHIEGGINYMISFIPALPKGVFTSKSSSTSNNTVDEKPCLEKLKSISKSFFTQRLEDIKPSSQNKKKPKIKRKNCHVFIPQCLFGTFHEQGNEDDNQVKKDIILPISTLFCEERDGDLFYYIKYFEKIFKKLKELLESSNDDKKIPSLYRTTQLVNLCKGYTSKVKDDQGNYDTQYRDLIHRYAYYKATGVQETSSIMSGIMNGISDLKQNIYGFINSEKNKEVIESLKRLSGFSDEKLGSNIKENIKDFIKVYDIFIKEYNIN